VTDHHCSLKLRTSEALTWSLTYRTLGAPLVLWLPDGHFRVVQCTAYLTNLGSFRGLWLTAWAAGGGSFPKGAGHKEEIKTTAGQPWPEHSGLMGPQSLVSSSHL
jgi:hypothetical protein